MKTSLNASGVEENTWRRHASLYASTVARKVTHTKYAAARGSQARVRETSEATKGSYVLLNI